jgi:hypothetical protein
MLQICTFQRLFRCSLWLGKHLIAVVVVNYIYKAGIVPPDEFESESEIESESDVHMVQNWQNICRKLVIVPLLKRL